MSLRIVPFHDHTVVAMTPHDGPHRCHPQQIENSKLTYMNGSGPGEQPDALLSWFGMRVVPSWNIVVEQTLHEYCMSSIHALKALLSLLPNRSDTARAAHTLFCYT